MTSSQRRGDFVSAVTHELRTPLTTFRLYTDLLADDALGPEERRSYLETLQREGERLGHLVDNVLDYSRLERRAAPRPERHRLGSLLERFAPRLAERAGRGGLELELRCAAEHAERSVVADPASVERILLNLVDNACKYGGNPERPRLVIETGRARGRMIVRVSDRGAGVPAAARRRLFRPFERAGAGAGEAATPGIGLGLAISRRLARGFGGDLRLAGSREGAVFELLLPEGG